MGHSPTAVSGSSHSIYCSRGSFDGRVPARPLAMNCCCCPHTQGKAVCCHVQHQDPCQTKDQRLHIYGVFYHHGSTNGEETATGNGLILVFQERLQVLMIFLTASTDPVAGRPRALAYGSETFVRFELITRCQIKKQQEPADAGSFTAERAGIRSSHFR